MKAHVEILITDILFIQQCYFIWMRLIVSDSRKIVNDECKSVEGVFVTILTFMFQYLPCWEIRKRVKNSVSLAYFGAELRTQVLQHDK
jgi:hypothetical protein